MMKTEYNLYIYIKIKREKKINGGMKWEDFY